ncbi:similar to Saccharomyces cerevisiae YOL080C REX4 Putative RNA exonuclease possibly involved in pre-rRNA processing and ribosome assembly [Maudiozyma saulgeensis]|uniref:RNA exonuclease 4 n=1 Tax=Maudiozyma saulgeensis TaxID=1789683 RepID=A0A1X7R097_9SACH|nr:similar to Saccharomyces cerevisiae YOL080C REX4 Putative RNA exonuclease possibly involved in pre-rRNA processing and ribosome assembly [Kazachstania saulgeensis]
MALSSNWLKLQEASSTSKSKKQSKNATSNKVHKPQKKKFGSKWREERIAKKPNKIMSMVYSMNDAIAKHKENKRDGKAFEFKSENDKDEGSSASTPPNFDGLPQDKKSKEIGKFVAMDCEFVGIGADGKDSALARISITNFFGHIIIDEFVKPRETVTDWRTWVSGVKPQHMKNAISFKEAQKRCAEILEGRILVGHAIKHDLEALLLSHPRSMIRDTAKHLPFRKAYAMGKSPSLKKLSKEILKIDIQDGQHSSVEDARITMMIYKSDKKEFERLHRTTFTNETK